MSEAAVVHVSSDGVARPSRAGVRRMLCGEACFVLEDGTWLPPIAFVGVEDGRAATCPSCRRLASAGRIEIPPSPGIRIPRPPVG